MNQIPWRKKLPKTCRSGLHKLSEESVYRHANGRCWSCRECNRLRSREFVQKHRETLEKKVSVGCPECGGKRDVVATTARRLEKTPWPCLRCSRRAVRGRISFKKQICNICGKEFQGRSGAARKCDMCAKRKEVAQKTCCICEKKYYGYKNKTACSSSCLRRIRENKRYFGGRMFFAEGWHEKKCQICERDVKKVFHVHHVFGHPNHSRLIVTCRGCHNLISILASTKYLSLNHLKKILWYAIAQKTRAFPEYKEPTDES